MLSQERPIRGPGVVRVLSLAVLGLLITCQPSVQYRDRLVYQDRVVYRDRIVHLDEPASTVLSPPAVPSQEETDDGSPPESRSSTTAAHADLLAALSPFQAVTFDHCYDGNTCTVNLQGLPPFLAN